MLEVADSEGDVGGITLLVGDVAVVVVADGDPGQLAPASTVVALQKAPSSPNSSLT